MPQFHIAVVKVDGTSIMNQKTDTAQVSSEQTLKFSEKICTCLCIHTNLISKYYHCPILPKKMAVDGHLLFEVIRAGVSSAREQGHFHWKTFERGTEARATGLCKSRL